MLSVHFWSERGPNGFDEAPSDSEWQDPHCSTLQEGEVHLSSAHEPHTPQFVWAMLEMAQAPTMPLLGLTRVQYRQAFKQVCSDLDIAFTPHAARHLFGSYQALLTTPVQVVAAHLVHADPVKTTQRVYTHELSAQEKAIVFANPDIFKPAQPLYQFGALQAPAPQFLE